MTDKEKAKIQMLVIIDLLEDGKEHRNATQMVESSTIELKNEVLNVYYVDGYCSTYLYKDNKIKFLYMTKESQK